MWMSNDSRYSQSPNQQLMEVAFSTSKVVLGPIYVIIFGKLIGDINAIVRGII